MFIYVSLLYFFEFLRALRDFVVSIAFP